MSEAHFLQAEVSHPPIGADLGSRSEVIAHKTGERFGGTVWDDAEPQPASIDTTLERLAALMLLPCRGDPVLTLFAQADFDGSYDPRHVVRTAPLAPRLPADKALVDFHGILAADRFAVRSDHPGAQLVQ